LPRLSALHLVVLCPVQCTFSPGLPHTREVWADKPGTVLATSLGPRTSGPGLGWGLVQALTAPMLTAPMATAPILTAMLLCTRGVQGQALAKGPARPRLLLRGLPCHPSAPPASVHWKPSLISCGSRRACLQSFCCSAMGPTLCRSTEHGSSV
jgi:hypothetical protein